MVRRYFDLTLTTWDRACWGAHVEGESVQETSTSFWDTVGIFHFPVPWGDSNAVVGRIPHNHGPSTLMAASIAVLAHSRAILAGLLAILRLLILPLVLTGDGGLMYREDPHGLTLTSASDTYLCCGSKVHIVHTNTGATHHLQTALGGLKHSPSNLPRKAARGQMRTRLEGSSSWQKAHLGSTSDDQSVSVCNLLVKLLRGQSIRAIYISYLLQQSDTCARKPSSIGSKSLLLLNQAASALY